MAAGEFGVSWVIRRGHHAQILVTGPSGDPRLLGVPELFAHPHRIKSGRLRELLGGAGSSRHPHASLALQTWSRTSSGGARLNVQVVWQLSGSGLGGRSLHEDFDGRSVGVDLDPGGTSRCPRQGGLAHVAEGHGVELLPVQRNEFGQPPIVLDHSPRRVVGMNSNAPVPRGLVSPVVVAACPSVGVGRLIGCVCCVWIESWSPSSQSSTESCLE